jgi:nucleoside-diphosphate-sugar epimerase
VEALLLAAASDNAIGEIYNLGADDVISLRDLAALLVEINGSGAFRLVPFPPEQKAIDIGDYYGHYGKIQQALGWAPRVSLRAGLARTLDFYRDHLWKYVGPS